MSGSCSYSTITRYMLSFRSLGLGRLRKGGLMAGEIVHIEFPSENADRAQQFWSGLFGGSQSPEMDYRMAQTGEMSGVAVFPSNERSGHPNYYFLVDDMDTALAR